MFVCVIVVVCVGCVVYVCEETVATKGQHIWNGTGQKWDFEKAPLLLTLIHYIYHDICSSIAVFVGGEQKL